MTRREHAQIERGVINLDTGRAMICCWDECDRRATVLYKHTSCLHDVRLGCQTADLRTFLASGQTAHLDYVFCTMRHRNYWVNAAGRNAQESIARTGRAYGNLPVGLRGMIG